MPSEGELGLSSFDTGDSPSLIDRRSLGSGPIDLLAALEQPPRERRSEPNVSNAIARRFLFPRRSNWTILAKNSNM